MTTAEKEQLRTGHELTALVRTLKRPQNAGEKVTVNGVTFRTVEYQRFAAFSIMAWEVSQGDYLVIWTEYQWSDLGWQIHAV